MQTQELICGFCKDSTVWPVDNEIQMMVYGVNHLVYDCQKAPVEAVAEAIVYLESMKGTDDES